MKELEIELAANQPQTYYLNVQYLLLDLEDVKLLKSGTQYEVCKEELPQEVQWHIRNIDEGLQRKMIEKKALKLKTT